MKALNLTNKELKVKLVKKNINVCLDFLENKKIST